MYGPIMIIILFIITQTTVHCVCRHYFDMSPQIWSSKDVSSFRGHVDFSNYLRENNISCVIAIDALLTCRLLRGTNDF